MRSSRFNSIVKSAAMAVGLVAGVSSAQAGVTTVQAPIYGGELSIAQILSGVYGETFAASGEDFVSAGITAKRMDDFGIIGPLSTTGAVGSAADEVWQGSFTKATAKARYAGYNQEFGYIDGESGGTYTKLLDVVGNGTAPAVTGEAVDINVPGLFRLARGGQNGVFSSKALDNADSLDHMVTYQIQGLADAGSFVSWMVFFEDLNQIAGVQSSDRDFNDLAVELKAAVVPLPPAALMGLIGLAIPAGMNVAKRFRRKA